MDYYRADKNDWIKYEQDGKDYLAHLVLPIPVNIEHVAKDNIETKSDIHEKLNDAVFLLSQTRIGRHLLGRAQNRDAKIIIDDSLFGNNQSSAFVLSGDIYLKSKDSVVELALSLSHELAHIAQKDQKAFQALAFHLRLDNAIRGEWATEAEAFAATAQFALELSVKDPEDPENAWKTDVALEAFKEKDVLGHLIAQSLLDNDLDGIFNGYHMALQFSLFYSEPEIRRTYATAMIKHFNFVKDKISPQIRFLSYRSDFQGEVLSEQFHYFGTQYLSKFLPEMDLMSGDLAALPEDLKEDIVEFYEGLGITHIFEKMAVQKIETYKDKDIEPKIFVADTPKTKVNKECKFK